MVHFFWLSLERPRSLVFDNFPSSALTAVTHCIKQWTAPCLLQPYSIFQHSITAPKCVCVGGGGGQRESNPPSAFTQIPFRSRSKTLKIQQQAIRFIQVKPPTLTQTNISACLAQSTLESGSSLRRINSIESWNTNYGGVGDGGQETGGFPPEKGTEIFCKD